MARAFVRKAPQPQDTIVLEMSRDEAKYLLYFIRLYASTRLPDGPVMRALAVALAD